MKKTLSVAVVALFIAVVLGLGAAPVVADGVPDFNLFVCQSCTTPPSAPTLLTDLSAFNVGDGGNHATLGTLLIIVGTYNGAPAPTLSFGSNTFTPGGTPVYGWNGSSAGVLFNSSSPDAYTALGIAPKGGGNSETVGNWNSSPEGLAGHGITPATSFELFVYEITGATLPAMGAITMDMTGGTTGSFVIGYDCETTDNPCPDGKEGATPFTTSGIVDTVSAPEPASLGLLATGLLGLVGFARRRFSNS